MKIIKKWCAWALAIAVTFSVAAVPAFAQSNDQQHVVTPGELNQAAARQPAARQANENAIRHLLASDAGQKALKSTNVDYERVDKAISQLDDAELAKLADRSRQAENDFAAGLISAKTLAYIILAIVVIVVIIVLV